MNLLLVLIASLMLSGCLGIGGPVLPEEGKVITVDMEYYKECEPLKTLENSTFEAVLDNTIENVAIYKKCRDKQHNSILLIKKFTNVKE